MNMTNLISSKTVINILLFILWIYCNILIKCKYKVKILRFKDLRETKEFKYRNQLKFDI